MKILKQNNMELEKAKELIQQTLYMIGEHGDMKVEIEARDLEVICKFAQQNTLTLDSKVDERDYERIPNPEVEDVCDPEGVVQRWYDETPTIKQRLDNEKRLREFKELILNNHYIMKLRDTLSNAEWRRTILASLDRIEKDLNND